MKVAVAILVLALSSVYAGKTKYGSKHAYPYSSPYGSLQGGFLGQPGLGGSLSGPLDRKSVV